MLTRACGNEELRAVGVWTTICHTQCTTCTMLKHRM